MSENYPLIKNLLPSHKDVIKRGVKVHKSVRNVHIAPCRTKQGKETRRAAMHRQKSELYMRVNKPSFYCAEKRTAADVNRSVNTIYGKG